MQAERPGRRDCQLREDRIANCHSTKPPGRMARHERIRFSRIAAWRAERKTNEPVWADRIVRALFALLAAAFYGSSSTSGGRYPLQQERSYEGASRWALIQAQFADGIFRRSDGTQCCSGRATSATVQYPPLKGGLKRGGWVLALVGAAGLALAIALKVNCPAGTRATRNSVRCWSPKRLTGRRGLILGDIIGTVIRNADPAHILMIAPIGPARAPASSCLTAMTTTAVRVLGHEAREFRYSVALPARQGREGFSFPPGGTQSHRYNPLDFVRRDENMPTDSPWWRPSSCPTRRRHLVWRRAHVAGDADWLCLGLSQLRGLALLRGVARMTVTGRTFPSS